VACSRVTFTFILKLSYIEYVYHKL
jgi:hypothetical protein